MIYLYYNSIQAYHMVSDYKYVIQISTKIVIYILKLYKF